MNPADIYLVGLASGVVLLPITSFRRLSPLWLKLLLVAAGCLLIIRYLMLGLPDPVAPPMGRWSAPFVRLTGAIGVTLPGIFAMDQLIRHPAMTPQKLLRWCAPLIALDLVTCWRIPLAMLVQGAVGLGLASACAMLGGKIPVPSIRKPLAILGLAYGMWAAANLLIGLATAIPLRWMLLAELNLMLAVWHAFDMSATPQNS
ncbi:MAG: hypothetical protein HY737_04645 [Candidatus Omnitrophica bacterium]|nr:hypothetical protein [Candidatus Omnitrophota bacterium]